MNTQPQHIHKAPASSQPFPLHDLPRGWVAPRDTLHNSTIYFITNGRGKRISAASCHGQWRYQLWVMSETSNKFRCTGISDYLEELT